MKDGLDGDHAHAGIALAEEAVGLLDAWASSPVAFNIRGRLDRQMMRSLEPSDL